jgi:hypothetical protein
MQQFHNIITWRLCVAQHVSGTYNCISNLWFYCWSMVVAALLVVAGQTTTNNTATTMLQQ